MKCSICGHEGRLGAVTCSRCGAPISQGAPEIEVDDRTTLRSIVAELPAQPVSAPLAPEPAPADLSPSPSAGPDPAWSTYPASGEEQLYAPAAPLQVDSSPTPPASVERIKVLAFVMAGLGTVSIIMAISISSGAGIQTLAGIVGMVLYVVLAIQVQARKEWARVLIGVFAILGFIANLVTLVTTLGVLALFQGMLGNSYVAPIVFGLILDLAGEVLLIALVVNAFHRDTAAWCAPVPLRAT